MEKQKRSSREMSHKGRERSPAGQQAKGVQPMPPGGQMAQPPKGTPPMHTGNK